MDLGISGRRAAVAASSRGLGFGCAAALAAEGVRVAVCGRDPDAVAAAAERIGAGAVPVVADVGTVAGATGFVERARDALGGIDILITNAGGPPTGGFADTPVEAYARAFELNALSTIAMCAAAVPEMRAAGWGRVVAITSSTVRQPSATLILSNTARAGTTAFLKTLATEVAPDGVTVNSLQPGFHATDRLTALGADLDELARTVPTRSLGTAADFGAFAAFLCSDHARFVTGTGIPVDGGAYPGLL